MSILYRKILLARPNIEVSISVQDDKTVVVEMSPAMNIFRLKPEDFENAAEEVIAVFRNVDVENRIRIALAAPEVPFVLLDDLESWLRPGVPEMYGRYVVHATYTRAAALDFLSIIDTVGKGVYSFYHDSVDGWLPR